MSDYLQRAHAEMTLQASAAAPTVSRPFEQFITEADIEQYTKALQWWPNPEVIDELPGHMGPPTIYMLCSDYGNYSHPHGTTFNARLLHYTSVVSAWLTENKYSVSTPNESPAERKARKNREAQARFRSNRKEPWADHAHQQRVDVEVEALAALTVERDAALAELDKQVLTAQDSFLRLCAHRTAERYRYSTLVKAQRELVSATKRGQP